MGLEPSGPPPSRPCHATSCPTQILITGVLAVAAEKSRQFITKTLPQVTVQGANWVAANRGTAATCGAVGAGLVLIAAPGAVVVPALGAVGFGANGVVAGKPPVFFLVLPARYIYVSISMITQVDVVLSSRIRCRRHSERHRERCITFHICDVTERGCRWIRSRDGISSYSGSRRRDYFFRRG